MNQNLNDIHRLTMENYDPFTGGKEQASRVCQTVHTPSGDASKQGLCPHMKNSRLRAVPVKQEKIKSPDFRGEYGVPSVTPFLFASISLAE